MGDFFNFISAPFTQWLKNRAAEKQAEHELRLSVTRNKQRLASDKQSYNHNWEMASLANKDTGLRYVSYSIFAMPILITVLSPAHGQAIFTNLDHVPNWWVKTFVAINGGVWGIVELKNAAPQLIAAVKGVMKRE